MKEHSRNTVLELVGVVLSLWLFIERVLEKKCGKACFINGSLCLIFKITTFFFQRSQKFLCWELITWKENKILRLSKHLACIVEQLFEIKRCLVLFVALFVLYHLLGSCNHEDVVNSKVHVYLHCISQKANIHLQNGKNVYCSKCRERAAEIFSVVFVLV